MHRPAPRTIPGVRRSIAVAASLVVLLAGCSHPYAGKPLPAPDLDRIIRQQAVDALARWDAAAKGFTGPVILLVGPPFGRVGEWEPYAANYQDSVDVGHFILDDDLPLSTQGESVLRLTDGRRVSLPTVSAAEAFNAAPRTAGSCDSCPILRIVGARLGKGPVRTTRGIVQMPLWTYDINGTSVKLTRPAVALPQPSVTPPPWDSTHPPAGVQAQSASGSVGGRTLTVMFIGGQCDDYRAQTIESDAAIVVLIYDRPRAAGVMCPMLGYPLQLTATLTRPLGERAVLEVREGTPVPTVRLP
jgi:hypothetical protein